jgi:hypothetical protein
MTKKLEELFNLPPITTDNLTADENLATLEKHQTVFKDIDSAIDKIDQALPRVRDLDTSDQELDELADLAKNRFNDLMDLGMNMEARFSGQVFQTAGVLLGHAITAKQAKLDKKLRMVDLQLKKMRLDHQIEKDKDEQDHNSAIEGQGMVIDRNSLLSQILNKPKQ